MMNIEPLPTYSVARPFNGGKVRLPAQDMNVILDIPSSQISGFRQYGDGLWVQMRDGSGFEIANFFSPVIENGVARKSMRNLMDAQGTVLHSTGVMPSTQAENYSYGGNDHGYTNVSDPTQMASVSPDELTGPMVSPSTPPQTVFAPEPATLVASNGYGSGSGLADVYGTASTGGGSSNLVGIFGGLGVGAAAAAAAAGGGASTKDVEPPRAPSLELATDSGTSGSDGITNVATINVSGLESGASWQYQVDGGTWVTGTGSTITATAGSHAYSVKQTDVAGNVSSASSVATYNLDTVITTPTLALLTDSGTDVSDGITNVATINVSGLESGASWQYQVDGGTWVTGTGSTITATSGSHTYAVRQSDTAGNTATSTTHTYVFLEETAYLVDAEVSGVSYYLNGSSTAAGTTGIDGSFGYQTGQTVTFKVGNLVLGTMNTSLINSDKQVLLQDLVGVTNSNTDDDRVINLARFLQSLDSSGTLSDGIQIAVTSTGADIDIQSLSSTALDALLTGLGVTTPVTKLDAITHLTQQTFDVRGSAIISVVDIVSDAVVNATDNASSMVFSGVSQGLASATTVTLTTDSGHVLGTGMVVVDGNGDGTWTVTASAGVFTSLVDGAKTLTVTATDSSSVVLATGEKAFSLDLTVPMPSLALATDSGTSGTDGITNVATINVSGREATASWQYQVDAGSWVTGTGSTITATSGSHTYSVKQTDASGNASSASSAVTYVLDTSIATPTLALSADTGTSTSDGITYTSMVNVTGIESGATWQYQVDSGSWVTGSGASFTATAGSHTYAVKQTDTAGNTATSTTSTYVLDTTVSAPTLALLTDSGSSTSDEITNIATINVTGLESGASWQYEIDSSGTWLTGSGSTITASSGEHTYDVKQTDIAGNVSNVSGLITVDYDATAPNAITDLTVTSSTTPSSATTPTWDDRLPTFSGTAEALSTVKLYNNGTTLLATVVVDSNGDWTYTPSSNISYGNYSVTATVTDTAGNVSVVSDASDFDLRSASVATPTFVLANDTGSSASDRITSDATVNVSLDAYMDSWEYSLDAGASWITGAGTSFELADDAVYAIGDIQVRQTNDFATISTVATNTVAWTTDMTAPGAPSDAFVVHDNVGMSYDLSTNNVTDDVTPTFSGTAVAGELVKVYYDLGAVTGSLLGSVTANDQGTWSFTPSSSLAAGSYTTYYSVTDAAGNESSYSGDSLSFTLDTTNSSTSLDLAADASSADLIQLAIATNSVTQINTVDLGADSVADLTLTVTYDDLASLNLADVLYVTGATGDNLVTSSATAVIASNTTVSGIAYLAYDIGGTSDADIFIQQGMMLNGVAT
jgi:hypothetical protein